MNKRAAVILMLLAALGAVASATTFTPCTTAGNINDVNTTLSTASGNTVQCGAFTFSNFSVSVTGQSGAAAQLNIQGAPNSFASADGSAFLAFNIGSISGVIGDILLDYTVTGPLSYVDNVNLGTANPNVQIIEDVYTTANCTVGGVFSYSLCSNPLTQLVTNGGTSGTSSVFATSQSSVIIKDIQFHNDGEGTNASISEFTNSQHTPVPEPVTLSMMGLGLLGLGLMRRRQVKK